MINDHLQSLAGYPVHQWHAGEPVPAGTIPRITLDYEAFDDGKSWLDQFALFLAEENDLSQLPGLIVGAYDYESGESSGPIVEAIVDAKDRFPSLKYIFVGDILSEEFEMSWIQQSDVSPLLSAFPELEYLGVRGGTDLHLSQPQHEKLKTLVIQTGGLDRRIIKSLDQAQFPALEHLELYLGTDNYGGNITTQNLAPLLNGVLFPKLNYLGLRNSDIADDVAKAVAAAPIVDNIRVLDLSLGTLGDEGAQSLLDSPAIQRLEKLDLHYHFCTEAMQEKLKQLPLQVDVSDVQKGYEYDGVVNRYVSVGE